MRSLNALLMPTDDIVRTSAEKPAGDIVRLLLACPGLLPSPHIPQENVQDGVVSRFELTVSNDDFHAVLSLTEPFVPAFVPYSFHFFRRTKPGSGRIHRRRHSWIYCLSTSPVAKPFRRAAGAEYLPIRSTRC